MEINELSRLLGKWIHIKIKAKKGEFWFHYPRSPRLMDVRVIQARTRGCLMETPEGDFVLFSAKSIIEYRLSNRQHQEKQGWPQ